MGDSLKPAAIIFDMDKTLVQSASIWKFAEARVLRAMGSDWSAELATQYKGMNAFDVARVMHEQMRGTLPLPQCQQMLRETLIERFALEGTGMPGAVDLVRRLEGRYRLAVASGSPLQAIEIALKRLGIFDAFDQVITSEDVVRGKPHPDVFLRAAEALGIAADKCVVVEDSAIGCRAAIAAGMRCFVVPSVPIELVAPIATRIFTSLTEIGELELNS